MDHNLKFVKDEKHGTDERCLPAFNVGDGFESDPELVDMVEDGKERPIRLCSLRSTFFFKIQHLIMSISGTDADYAIRLISLEDDPTLPIWTFRMWFLSLGLSCFGAVLGQIFVSI
jgi:hypothetical protein